MKVAKILFPCVAWDRSVSWDRNESTTKVLFPEQTARVLGAGIVGPNASDRLAEVTVAIEMGCEATGIGQYHPPPPDPLGKRQIRRRDVRGEPSPTSSFPTERAS